MRWRTSFVVGVAGLLASPAIAGADPLPRQQETVTTKVAELVRAVEVADEIGTITIRPGTATSVTARLSYVTERPRVTVEVVEGVLKVRARCDDGVAAGPVRVFLIRFCTADLDLVVPAKVDVRATNGNGAIRVMGLRAPRTCSRATATSSFPRSPAPASGPAAGTATSSSARSRPARLPSSPRPAMSPSRGCALASW